MRINPAQVLADRFNQLVRRDKHQLALETVCCAYDNSFIYNNGMLSGVSLALNYGNQTIYNTETSMITVYDGQRVDVAFVNRGVSDYVTSLYKL